jgi:hypothetical protein
MEQRLRFFEHRLLRKILGLERDEINMERRSEDFYYLLSILFTNCHLGDEIKKNEKGEAHSTYGMQERRKRFLAEKPGG